MEIGDPVKMSSSKRPGAYLLIFAQLVGVCALGWTALQHSVGPGRHVKSSPTKREQTARHIVEQPSIGLASRGGPDEAKGGIANKTQELREKWASVSNSAERDGLIDAASVVEREALLGSLLDSLGIGGALRTRVLHSLRTQGVDSLRQLLDPETFNALVGNAPAYYAVAEQQNYMAAQGVPLSKLQASELRALYLAANRPSVPPSFGSPALTSDEIAEQAGKILSEEQRRIFESLRELRTAREELLKKKKELFTTEGS